MSVIIDIVITTLLTFLQMNASLPYRFLAQMFGRTWCHDVLPSNPGRRAVHHTYIRVAVPGPSQSHYLTLMLMYLTLYPAAYPRPGKREKNFVPTGAAAFSLNMTVFNCEAEVI